MERGRGGGAPSSGPIEVEVKFVVGPGTEAALAALGAVGLPHIPPFRDTYFDGPSAPLGRADVWLRYRQGQGWQIKLPHGRPTATHRDPHLPDGGPPQLDGDPQPPHGDPRLPHGDPQLPHGAAETHGDAEAARSPPETSGGDPQPPHGTSETLRRPPAPHSPPKPHTPSPPHRSPDPPCPPEPHSPPKLTHSPPKPHIPPQPHSSPDPYDPPKPHSPPEPHSPPPPHSSPAPHGPTEPCSPPKLTHSPPKPHSPPPPHSSPAPHGPPEAPRSPPAPPGVTTTYREVWGEAEVLRELGRVLGAPGAPWGSVGRALGPLGLRPTASFVTARRGARRGALRVLLDRADFGYGVGEVEEELPGGGGDPREVAAAVGRVEGLCRALGVAPQQRVPGKLSVFLARHRPRYYRLLRAFGRLEEVGEGREGATPPPPPPQ